MKYAILLLATLAITAHGQTPTERNAIDVPAIQEEYGPLVVTLCDNGCWDMPYHPGEWMGLEPSPHRATQWICTDKTRFLLTAEDGSKHCIALRNPATDQEPEVSERGRLDAPILLPKQYRKLWEEAVAIT